MSADLSALDSLYAGTGLSSRAVAAPVAKSQEPTKANKPRDCGNEAAQNVARFKSLNPAASAWMDAASKNGSEFAVSLLRQVSEKGELTERQIAAALKAAETDARASAGPVVSIGGMISAMNAARSAGIKKPAIRTELFIFKAAPLTGNNPGAIYITGRSDSAYLGKIMDGKLSSRESDETVAKIVEVCNDPLAAAVAYGKETGICSCCGRELTDEDSIADGIGPICKQKYGF